MQTFLRTSFLLFFVALFVIFFLFLRKSEPPIKEEISSNQYSELVAQLPITSVTSQIVEIRQNRIMNPALQNKFDQALLRQAKRVQNRLDKMNPTESFYYLKNLLGNTEKGLQSPDLSSTERYYHLTMLQILYTQSQLKAQLPQAVNYER